MKPALGDAEHVVCPLRVRGGGIQGRDLRPQLLARDQARRVIGSAVDLVARRQPLQIVIQ